MENVSDAVLMAGQILIFIIALSVCMSSLTIVRVEIDRIIGRTETVQMARNGDTYINYLQSNSAKATRKVGVETVVSSMYRSIKENYVVYVVLADQNAYNTLDVDHVKLERDLFINGVKKASEGDEVIKTTIGHGTNQEINQKLKGGLYNYLKGRNFFEYLGEYQNDTSSNLGVEPENKQTYRIITYIETT